MELMDTALHIEALIFASDRPLDTTEITDFINHAFGFLDQTFTEPQIESVITFLVTKYAAPQFAFAITESGGGWQFLTKPAYYKTVAQLNGEKFLKRLSVASMETLSVVAYKQPVTKGEIESIRGVNSDYSLQKLLEKELIIISGRQEEMPGKPLLYATSRTFMDYFGINSVRDLPHIKEVLAGQPVEPTAVNEETNNTAWLAVNDDGNLVASAPENGNPPKDNNDMLSYS